jgi:hypothetical protein
MGDGHMVGKVNRLSKSTDGWQFSGDAVRFAGRTAAAVRA